MYFSIASSFRNIEDAKKNKSILLRSSEGFNLREAYMHATGAGVARVVRTHIIGYLDLC